MRPLLLALLLALALPAAAEAQHVHVVEAGETLASIAQLYYGDPKQERALRVENHLSGEGPRAVSPGMRLQIPFVAFHRAEAGETWASLAERYYGDARREAGLRQVNRGRAEAPGEGEELLIPPLLVVTPQAAEMLVKIARAHLGKDRAALGLLRAFNPELGNKVEKGAYVFVPRVELRLSPEGIARLSATQADATPAEGDARDRQERVSAEIPALAEHLRRGRYIEAVALGNQLLGVGGLTGNQELTIQRALGTAYVALEREDLAEAAFARALALQPDLELDSLRTSPRVQKVFRSAQLGRGAAAAAAE